MPLSAADLKTKIQAILKDADLEQTSAKKVRTQLEEDVGEDLTERKEEINGIIKEVMDEMDDEDEDEEEKEEDDDGDEDYEEEKEEKKTKASPKKAATATKRKKDDDSEEEEEDEEEEESEEEAPAPKKRPRAAPPKPANSSEDEEEEDPDSNFSDEKGSFEGESSSEGGDSDYAPDELMRSAKRRAKAQKGRRGRGRGRAAVKRKGTRYNSSSDESSGEEWGKAKKKPAARRKKAGSDDSDSDFTPKKRGGGGGGGFTKPQQLSEELADIVGTDVAPRHEVVKQMWAYIKENKLQDPKNKQFAKCDDKLLKVIGEKKFRCFGMAKYLKDHMTPA